MAKFDQKHHLKYFKKCLASRMVLKYLVYVMRKGTKMENKFNETKVAIKFAFKKGQKDFKMYGSKINVYIEEKVPLRFKAYELGYKTAMEFHNDIFYWGV